MRTPNGLIIDSPAWPLLQAVISYWGITTTAGNAFGTSIIDALCSTAGAQPSYEGLPCKILDGPSAGQLQIVWAHNLATGEMSFANPFTNPAGGVQQQAASVRFVILSVVGGGGGPGPSPGGNYGPTVFLDETWQDELGIDMTRWTVTNPATGAAWARGAVGAYLMAVAAPNANENARLRSNQRWVCTPTVYGPDQILRRFTLEFESYLQVVGNIDNANFFLGLTNAQAATRASNNIIGFGLVAGALQTITDSAGLETTNTGFGEVLTNLNKFRIDVFLNTVQFSLNETIIATHATNLPDSAMWINFYYPTGAGGASILSLGIIRAWFEDVT